MTINDDWLVRDVFEKYVEALDELLSVIKKSGLLEDSSFRDWTDSLYKVIYKYSNND